MISGSQVFDGERRRGTQAIGDHRNLVMDLVIFLNLDLWVVLCILFEEFYLESVDTTIIIDGVEVDLNASCQRLAYGVCNRPRIRLQDTKRDSFVRDIATGT